MKPDYKNWVPKGMIAGYFSGTIACLIAAVVFGVLGFIESMTWAVVLFAIFALASFVLAVVTAFMLYMHNTFSYNGKRQLSRRIIDGIADRVVVPEGGKCLDVGCGSGALSIAVAKRNPCAKVTGVDRWGKEYASFSRALCKQNTEAEGIKNATFQRGDATMLPFKDETFDVVVSNYVYHNIPSTERQAILLETLRTLKKGGTFYIHDLFTASKYGDMRSFMKKLKRMGYETVELTDTTKGTLMSEKEAKFLFLSGSALLMGKK